MFLRRSRPLVCLSSLLLACLAALSHSVSASVLSEYVATPDSAYAYTLTGVVPAPGYKIHNLQMTSQQWRMPGEVDRTEWKHAVAVVVPDNVTSQTAMLWITGGDNGDATTVPTSDLQLVVQIALASRSVVAAVAQVPNQPLFFGSDTAPFSEDKLVAYSWDRAMDSGDYTWVAYLPMVKSAVRAMDTVQTYLAGATGQTINDFVAAGASKRGAATWLTAAVDNRVRALAPAVFDILNMAPQLEHHYQAYGSYSFAVQDYVDFDIVRRFRIPEGRELRQVADPYSYLAVLSKPKFLINATGDQFFLPDSARFYLQDLPGETHIRYVPNTDHSLSTSAGGATDALFSLVAWYQTILMGTPRPGVSWSLDGGRLSVTTDGSVLAARRWDATNPTARDFRKATIGETWANSVLSANADGSFTIDLSPPEMGWRASFVELVFQGPAGIPQSYSTPIFVSPDTLPFTLADAFIDPKGKGYWDRQVDLALRDSADSNGIGNYFPFPVLGHYINTLFDADAVFDPRRHGDRALQHCLAARLNVASGQFGWYTPVTRRHQTRYLWEYWNDAFDAYQAGHEHRAKEICESLNERRH